MQSRDVFKYNPVLRTHKSPFPAFSFPLARCIVNGITFTSNMDTAPSYPMCHAELIPKGSGSATPNFDRAFLARPNGKPDKCHQVLSSGRSRQNVFHMIARHVSVECLRRSKSGAQLTHSNSGMNPLRDVSSHAAHPQSLTSDMVIVQYVVGCTRPITQVNVCPYPLPLRRHHPWIPHHRGKFRDQISPHQLQATFAHKS